MPRPLRGILASTPLRSHARYTREEVLASLDYATLAQKPSAFVTGVLPVDDWDTDAFLITLNKSDADYSPTTMYQDYAISPSLFHWETQGRTSVASSTGQRYINHAREGRNILLFARENKSHEFGTGAPHLLLGAAQYVSHTGDRPIAITWHLDRPMPTETFTASTVVA